MFLTTDGCVGDEIKVPETNSEAKNIFSSFMFASEEPLRLRSFRPVTEATSLFQAQLLCDNLKVFMW